MLGDHPLLKLHEFHLFSCWASFLSKSFQPESGLIAPIDGNEGHRMLIDVPLQPTTRQCRATESVNHTNLMPFSIFVRQEAKFLPPQNEPMNLQRTHCPFCEQIFVKHYLAILEALARLSCGSPSPRECSFYVNSWYNHGKAFHPNHSCQIKGTSSQPEYVCRALRATPTSDLKPPVPLYVGPSASLWLLECRDR